VRLAEEEGAISRRGKSDDLLKWRKARPTGEKL
jgi:hypothetical protein